MYDTYMPIMCVHTQSIYCKQYSLLFYNKGLWGKKSMVWKGIERNKLDYILTDLLPVEISELFSFTKFYFFLMKKENQKKLNDIIKVIKESKAKGSKKMFENQWSTKPLKYRILKGNNTMREMSIIQPFSALNLFLFIECYQKDILNYFEKNHKFSIRYHKKSTDLYYKSKGRRITQYFNKQPSSVGYGAIQQVGNYFKIIPFESINSFADSRIWRMCNFKYKYYAKLDYKSCFDSIYTHAFTWIIERNVVDAKEANNSNLFVTIDRILQNINGRSSNGIVVGPEFSRMMAEVLLQHIDSEISISLSKENIIYNTDYVVFRYVDDIFLFANQPQVIEKVLYKYKIIGEKYLLRLNELKLVQGNTPCLPKDWLERTRKLSDVIGTFFYQGKKADYDRLPEEEKFLVKTDFIYVDRIKDEIATLVKDHSDDRRTIVSFLLSTLLNNISKKKNGYILFGKNGLGKALLLIDIALYIYAFYPSFDQSRKIISIISYMNNELNFKSDKNAHEKLSKVMNRYSFIFQSGNIFDLCDWLPFFGEYNIILDVKTENAMIKSAEECNDPIIWGNLLLYSKYYKSFHEEILEKITHIIEKQINKISDKEPMMQVEFWYILIFHNCPFISSSLRKRMSKIINSIADSMPEEGKRMPSHEITILVCKFLEQCSPDSGNKPKESLFNWNGIKDFSDQITYRTYQRTVFKHYRKSNYKLYASIN